MPALSLRPSLRRPRARIAPAAVAGLLLWGLMEAVALWRAGRR